MLMFRVSSMTNFWRKAALNCKKEGKPQSESNPGKTQPLAKEKLNHNATFFRMAERVPKE